MSSENVVFRENCWPMMEMKKMKEEKKVCKYCKKNEVVKTNSSCGHSFCKFCASKKTAKTCSECEKSVFSDWSILFFTFYPFIKLSIHKYSNDNLAFAKNLMSWICSSSFLSYSINKENQSSESSQSNDGSWSLFLSLFYHCFT